MTNYFAPPIYSLVPIPFSPIRVVPSWRGAGSSLSNVWKHVRPNMPKVGVVCCLAVGTSPCVSCSFNIILCKSTFEGRERRFVLVRSAKMVEYETSRVVRF